MSQVKRFVSVVGVDFSELGNHAIDAALEWSGLRGGEVHVVYVHQDLPMEAVFSDKVSQATVAETALEQLRQRAEERVRAMPVRPGAMPKRVVAHFRRGAPAEEIAQLAADLDADLVVVGSHGRRGLSKMLLGSVADRVSHLARCPVWIVRPKAHVDGFRVPEIEPPCPQCVAKREATDGKELWCARHSEHHIRAHHYAYVSDGIFSSNTRSYESTPEG